MLFCAMIAELLGGVVTDYLLRLTGNLQIARLRLIATSWTLAVAGLVPAIFVHDLVVGLAGFTVALFFLGFAISPLWTATMDIAPNYAGSSSALMNAGWCRCRHCLTSRIRLDPRTHRQLDNAVRLSPSGCCCLPSS